MEARRQAVLKAVEEGTHASLAELLTETNIDSLQGLVSKGLYETNGQPNRLVQQAIHALRALADKVADGELDLNDLGEVDKKLIGESLTILEEVISNREELVVRRAKDIAESLLGKPHQFDKMDDAYLVYELFYKGKWHTSDSERAAGEVKSLQGWAATQEGISTGVT
jgi:hypothetical protein